MYLVLDCETTGLPKRWDAPVSDVHNWPRAIQVAWSLFDDAGQRLESAVRLVQPAGFVIPLDVQRIHGITTERAMAEGEPIGQVLGDLSLAVAKADVLVAHNLKFDERILSAEYIRNNLPLPFGDQKRFCTMERTTELCRLPGSRGYKWPSLSQLYRELFQTTFEDAHDAGADVAACAKCFLELKKRGLTFF